MPNWRLQPPSLAVTPTAPRASARDAPAAPVLTLAADTRSVRPPGPGRRRMSRKVRTEGVRQWERR